MKERPILMSAPMVQACRRDINPKTVTRRICKLQPWEENGDWHLSHKGGITGVYHSQQACLDALVKHWCPYGVPGDRLWVRETFGVWRKTSVYCDEFEVGKEATRGLTLVEHEAEYGHNDLNIAYRADADDDGPWYPSIFMPRWASRILLEITDVRVERLQNISEEDAIAEGIDPLFDLSEPGLPQDIRELYQNEKMPWRNYLWHGCVGRPGFEITQKQSDYWEYQYSSYDTAVGSYSSLWEKINGKGSWKRNDWVWVVEFKKI